MGGPSAAVTLALNQSSAEAVDSACAAFVTAGGSLLRTVLDRGLVEATGRRATGLGHRPPELYRFVPAGAETTR